MEIAKNIALSGVKAVTVHDTLNTTWADLNGNFYLAPEHIGKNRAEQTLLRLSKLNPSVEVKALTCGLEVTLLRNIPG